MENELEIILADDEEIVLQTIGDYLRDSGHHVEEARNGLSAFRMIEAHDYDLGLIDVRMLGMDGISLLTKAMESRPDMSFVIITAHGNMEMVIQALRAGVADFLIKPIKFLELDAVLEKSLRLRSLRRDKRHLRETIRGIQTLDELRTKNRTLVGTSSATRKTRKEIQQAVEGGVRHNPYHR